MIRYIIIDLDGTLFDDNHRRELAEKVEWEKYHAACVEDFPYASMFWLGKIFEYFRPEAIKLKILFLTGRNESMREVTEGKIKQLFPHLEYDLEMRPTSNNEPTSSVKINLLTAWMEKEGAKLYQILYAIDDCNNNIEAFNKFGIDTLKVNYSKDAFPIHDQSWEVKKMRLFE